MFVFSIKKNTYLKLKMSWADICNNTDKIYSMGGKEWAGYILLVEFNQGASDDSYVLVTLTDCDFMS